jgi:membrane associated rhomboid family serine protease
VLFYLLGAIGSGFAQVLTNLESAIPAIGASGAVAAILGAYFVLYPRAKVNVLVPIIFIWTILQLSAFVVLGLWFLYQFIIPQPGVAWQAHAGGFIIGVLLILLFGGRPHPRRPVWQTEWRY